MKRSRLAKPMWRIVLDNIVLASALLNPHGAAARLLDFAYDGRLRLFTTDRILSFERRVLRNTSLSRHHGRAKKDVAEIVRDLPVLFCLVPDPRESRRTKGDFVSELLKCATVSHADFLVTSMALSDETAQQAGTRIVKADQLVKLVGREL